VLSNWNLFKIKKDIRSSIIPPRNTRRTFAHHPALRQSIRHQQGWPRGLADHIINECDSNDSKIHKNWEFGGRVAARWLHVAIINRANRPWSSTRHPRQLPWSAEGRLEKSLPVAGTQAGYCRRKKRKKILQIDIWPGRRDSHLHRRRRNQQIEAGS